MSEAGPGLPTDPAERLVTLVHELRTPLTIVAGFADVLAARGESLTPQQRAEFSERVAAGARELGALLDAERATRPGA